MSKVQLATKIDPGIKKALESVCQTRGLKMNRFIEEALLDKLEEMEDSLDIHKLRKEHFTPLNQVIKELKKSGKL